MKTLRNISLTLILSMMVISFMSCLKKSKDDPFISLHSRDGRLANEWKLKSADETMTFTFNGSTTTNTTSVINGIHSSSGSPYSLELTIEKDGKATCTVNDDGDINSYTSYWSWLETGKKKSTLLLGVVDWSCNSIWTVSRLANKELVLVHETSYSDSNSSETEKVTLTFEAK